MSLQIALLGKVLVGVMSTRLSVPKTSRVLLGYGTLVVWRDRSSGSVSGLCLTGASHLSLSASTWFQPSGMRFLSFGAGERRGRAVARLV